LAPDHSLFKQAQTLAPVLQKPFAAEALVALLAPQPRESNNVE
jgi:hypothetical protein